MYIDKDGEILLTQWLEDPSFINWARQSNSHDVVRWEEYFNEHTDLWELAKVGKEHVLGIAFREIDSSTSESYVALDLLLNKIEQNTVRVEHSEAKKVNQGSKLWKIAATIAILVSSIGLGYLTYFQNNEIVLATKYGNHLETYLPDGSHVTLNANSELKYYQRNPRKIWLKGEAFFDIEKKPENNENFQVITTDLKVTVLGTSFNVNARNDKTKVYLQEGIINLDVNAKDVETIRLAPGELVSYSKKMEELSEIEQIESQLEHASWKDGTLIFKDTPLAEALYEIEDIYGIHFVFRIEKLSKEVINGGVPIRNLDVTLQILKEVHGLDISSEGKRHYLNISE